MFSPADISFNLRESFNFIWTAIQHKKSDWQMRKHEMQYAQDLQKIGDPESVRISNQIMNGARLVDVLPSSKY